MSDAPNEQTPLIAVVHVAPPRQRYPHSTLRRICTFLLSAVLLMAIIVALLVLFILPDCEDQRRSHHSNKPCIPKHPFFRDHGKQHNSFGVLSSHDKGLTYPELVKLLAGTPDETKAREWSQYYTSGPHLAGKNLSQAEWTRDKWKAFGIEQSEIVSYEVYVNYPLGHRLALLQKSGKSNGDELDSDADAWSVSYEARLEEDELKEDPTSELQNRIPTFHGYSASGNVTAPFVFANYGTYHDFEDLLAANVSLEGKIALVKYGGIFRGLKVRRAQQLGMIGVVIYSDPGDDGETIVENGYKTYPDGPAREPSSVQRGSVQFLSVFPGDPTTPGYPSKPGCPRGPANISTPSIPSVPISYEDALPLLKALNGHGPKAKSLGDRWQGGGLDNEGVKYNIGPSPDDVVLNLVNEQEYVTTPFWNVIGIINGTLQDEVVVLGNHRDAWIAGGAGDPNSGSAALNEVVRSFGAALAKGWKPLRTIVFASWDGEEYGLVGSTEWVEDYLPWLKRAAVAYLNVDVGSSGPNFRTSTAPLLHRALIETTKLVLSPNQTKVGQTVYDVWNKHINTIGSGSDYTAFQDFAGVSSVDMGFTFGPDTPVYHYHSNYDSFHWMDTFGDPGFKYHATIARLWALLTARIVETPVLQFNATNYADALSSYLHQVKERAINASMFDEVETLSSNPAFKGLEFAIKRLHNASQTFDAQALALLEEVTQNPIPWWRWWERIKMYWRVKNVNEKYKRLEQQFLYEKGLDGRSWFKHVVFAPGLWTGYAGAVFPGLVEAIDEGDKGALWRWAGIITGCVVKATKVLTE